MFQKALERYWAQNTQAIVGNKVLAVKVIRGEGSLITVRGKRKLGYELDIEVTVDGPIKFQLIELCDHEEDVAEFRAIQGDSSVMRARRKDIVASIKDALEEYRLSIV